MSCLMSFVWYSPSSDQRKVSEKFKMMTYVSDGIRTSDPSLSDTLTTRLSGQITTWYLNLFKYFFRYDTTRILCSGKGIYRKLKYTNIVYLQFCGWYHLNTSWFIQKKKSIMYYIAMIIYNIYSFLFIIVYIVCSIIYLLILYVGIG